MGARRNFRRSEQAQKRPPGMEKKIAKRPPHGEKRPPDRGIVAKRTPYSQKKISRGGGGRSPTLAPPAGVPVRYMLSADVWKYR